MHYRGWATLSRRWFSVLAALVERHAMICTLTHFRPTFCTSTPSHSSKTFQKIAAIRIFMKCFGLIHSALENLFADDGHGLSSEELIRTVTEV